MVLISTAVTEGVCYTEVTGKKGVVLPEGKEKERTGGKSPHGEKVWGS